MESSDIFKEEYNALRTEICQSIAKQHEITLAGYGLASAAFGYIIGSNNVDWKSLAIIPLVLLAMTCLWAVECNRMVRASYYIAYVLWPSLCKIAHISSTTGWEVWIRIKDGEEGAFRRRQDFFQRMVIIYLPCVFSIAAISLVLLYSTSTPIWFWGFVGYAGVILFIWVAVYVHIRRISDLGAVDAPSNMGKKNITNRR